MTKTFITIGLYSTFVVLLLGFSGLFVLILQFKGSLIWLLSLMYSKMTIFVILSFVMYEVFEKFYKKL